MIVIVEAVDIYTVFVDKLSRQCNILEYVVANRLGSHANTCNVSNVFQSAYKQHHSTETAPLKVHNIITLSTDNGKFNALTMLNLF